MDAWLGRARAGGVRGMREELEGIPADARAVTTDPNGRFQLPSPGLDRVISLRISGPTIANETLYVLGRDVPEVRTVDTSRIEPRPIVLHASRFEHAASATKPVEGVARDQATGKPIAGLTIRANIDREGDATPIDGIGATTDAEGRYQLSGLPKAPGYRLFVSSRDGLPFVPGAFQVPASTPGLEPVPFDFALRRGIVLRGRVTDRVTGEPVAGSVDLFVFADNPHVGDFPGGGAGDLRRTRIGGDGRFEVVAIPGRSILAVHARDEDRYRGGVGVGAIPGLQKVPSDNPYFDTLPYLSYPRDYHAMIAIDLDALAGSSTRDLQLEPGRSIAITALGPDGKPIGAITVEGVGEVHPIPRRQASPTVEVHALDPSSPRRVTIRQEDRRLIGSLYLKGDEVEPMEVRLVPWGSIIGRIVDEAGRPRARIQLFDRNGIVRGPAEDRAILPDDALNRAHMTDDDGRFRVEGLIPGLKYGGDALDGPRDLGEVFEDVAVASGESKDLGDLKIVRPEDNGR